MKITNLCTGCAVCSKVCANNAIHMKKTQHGFINAIVDDKCCVSCARCVSVCPQNEKAAAAGDAKRIIAAWSKNDGIRKKSTSGGVFCGIASYILRHNGTVYGAGYTGCFDVRHIRIDNEKELHRLSGSKYLQSNMGNVYESIRKDLADNRPVLFSGTPCQVAAVKKYIDDDMQKNLYLVDIFCHGVPSPGVWKDYLKYTVQNTDDIHKISFRHKSPGWTKFSMRIELKNGDVYLKDMYHDPFLVGFLNDYLAQDACYQCKYASMARQGDISLGDFWSYVSRKYSERNTEKGISAVLINSSKGSRLWGEIEDDYVIVEKSPGEVQNGNSILSKPFTKNKRYDAFWKDYLAHGFEYVHSEYLKPGAESKKHRISRALDDYSFLMLFGSRRLYEKVKNKLKG